MSLNGHSGIFSISGRCILEHPASLFAPIYAWVDEYLHSPQAVTELTLNIEYMSSGVMHMLRRLLTQLSTLPEIHVLWQYEEDDEEMEAIGRELAHTCSLPSLRLVAQHAS